MNNELIVKVKSAIKKDDLQEFDAILRGEIPQSEIAAIFNLFCESGKLFKDSSQDAPTFPFSFANSFANTFPNYYFEHLNRLYYCNLAIICELIDESLYAKFENKFSNEIIQHLKIAFYHSLDKEKLLDKLEGINFENKDINLVLDELFLLHEIYSKNVLTNEELESILELFSWDIVLYSLCVFLEDFGADQSAQLVTEEIINQKRDSNFQGNLGDYSTFLDCIKLNKKNKKVHFCGHAIKGESIIHAYDRLRTIFDTRLNHHQIKTACESYCLQNNLTILETKENCFELNVKNIECEEKFQRDGIKYQIESNFFNLLTQELHADQWLQENLAQDYNLQLELAIKMSVLWLYDHGIIQSDKIDQGVKLNSGEVKLNVLVLFIAVQCIHSKRSYGDVFRKISENNIENLVLSFNDSFNTGIDTGIPFHVRTIDEFRSDLKTVFRNQAKEDSNFMEQFYDVLDCFIFDKKKEHDTPFSFDRYTHIKLGEKVFAFRKPLSETEPSHFAYNSLLRNNKEKEFNQNTKVIEKNINDALERAGFNVLSDSDRDKIKKRFNLDFDALAYKSGMFFSFEIKSTHFRQDLFANGLHTNRDLLKAAFQLDKNVDFIKTHSDVLANAFKCTLEEIERSAIKTYIVSTSLEQDHEYIGGRLKVSYFELMRVLRNEKDNVFMAYLLSSANYPSVYTSSFINELAKSKTENEFEEKVNVFINSHLRRDHLSAEELSENLKNSTLMDFMNGMKYSMQKIIIDKGIMRTEEISKIEVNPKNKSVVLQILGS